MPASQGGVMHGACGNAVGYGTPIALGRAGGCLSAGESGGILGVTPQEVRARVRSQQLLYV